MTTRILLVRHAESVWNAERRWQGQSDPPLSERGRAQAQRVAARLNGDVARVVSSDLQRAAQTAEIIAAELGLGDVRLEPALREIDVGAWAGLTTPEIEQRWPGAIERWRRGEFSPPEGEERSRFLDRLLAGLRRLSSDPGPPTLGVTHGAALGAIERHLGVHPGVAAPALSGRWVEVGEELRPLGERISFLDDS